jgi:HEAT repeat protein
MPLFGPPNIKKLEAKRDVSGLIKALAREKDGNVRREAAEALQWIGGAAAVEPLVAALEGSDKELAAVAAVALGKVGDSRAVEPLAAALADPDKRLARRAAEALYEVGDARAVEPLIAALRDEDREVRAAAAWAFAHVGDARAVEPLIAALGDEHSGVRRSAAFALGRIGDTRAVEPLVAVLPLENAASALIAIGDPQAVPSLLDALSFHRGAARELSRLGAAGVEPLIAALTSPDKAVRELAAETLGDIGDRRAVEPLVAALLDRNIDVSAAACGALESLHWQPEDVETSVAYWVARGEWAKCVESGTAAIDRLIVALQTGPTQVQLKAAESLAQIGDPRGIEALGAALRDYDKYVRKDAVTLLDTLGWQPDETVTGAAYWVTKEEWDKCVLIGAAAIEPLIDELAHEDWHNRKGAAAALVEIWRSGELGAAERKLLLAKRDTITEAHDDGYSRSRCGDESYDDHVDRGIGVDFPL